MLVHDEDRVTMLFAYNEDGTLQIVADVQEARRHFESSDVESGAITLFDEAGRPLAPVFPQRSERRILGVRVSGDPGPYDLVPDRATGAESLGDVLVRANVLMPNPWFADLASVRLRFQT